MKFTGIDGVIIDWYGIEDFYDYTTIHRNTVHIIKQLQKARLQFAICYEDRTIRKMIQEGHLPEEDAVKHGQEVMRFLQKNWFNSQGISKLMLGQHCSYLVPSIFKLTNGTNYSPFYPNALSSTRSIAYKKVPMVHLGGLRCTAG